MKTPTLIVRLVGIYLAIQSVIALIQINRITGLALGPAGASGSVVEEIRVLSVLGLIVGLVATSFAGILARWLTFDSEPGKKTDDLSDRLLASPAPKPNQQPEPTPPSGVAHH